MALLLGAGFALNASAQCPIKDEIIGQEHSLHKQPDGITGATTQHSEQATAATQNKTEKNKARKGHHHHHHRESETFNRFRVGGYGEAVAAFKDYGTNRFYGHPEGNLKQNRNTISIPRLVLALDYKFSPRWVLSTEVEFEAGGTGQAVEIENTENGEYETEIEKGGEVAIEQFHLSRLIHPAFNLRAGHMIVPVGLTNAHHEPLNFFGTVRPEGETTILPSTWHETGLSAFGAFGTARSRFDYETMLVAGLNANGFDRNTWVASGKQGFFEEDNFNAPALVGRLNWTGTMGQRHNKHTLRLGVSYYYCADAGRNSDKASTYLTSKPIAVNIFTADAQYINRYVIARGNIVMGNLSNSEYLSRTNGRLSNLSPYSRLTPVAAKAVSYAGEAGLRLRSLFGHHSPDLIPFVRYEYYNPQQKVEGAQVAEARLKTSMWVAGLNYRVGNGIVLKADYTTRRIGDGKYNSENELAVGIAFNTWFWSK